MPEHHQTGSSADPPGLPPQAATVPDPPEFAARVTGGPGEVVVAVRGEIDLSTREPFGRAVRQATAAGARRVVIDMADITFMDSSGLAVLAEAHRTVGEVQGAIVLRRVRPAVRTVLTLSGLDRLLSIQDPHAADDPSRARPSPDVE